MFTDLNNALCSSSSAIVSEHGSFVLIADALQADGSFLLHHYILSYLKGGGRVVLVGLEQSFFHYFSVARKMGVNLNSEIQLGNFVFVNALSSPYSDYTSTPPSTSSISAPSSGSEFTFQDASLESLKALYRRLSLLCHGEDTGVGLQGSNSVSSSTNRKTLLSVDGISILCNVFSHFEVAQFLIQCHSLVQQLQPESALAVLVHDDIASSTNEFTYGASLWTKISQLSGADLILKTSPLETGYSKEVHGQLNIIRTKEFSKEQSKLCTRFHYKITENTVKLFPV